MIQAAQLVAKVSVDGDVETKARLQSVGKTVDDTGGKLGGVLLGAGVVAGAALIGVGLSSLKMAGDFNASMTQLVTGAGEPPKNIDFLKNKIIDLSTSTGTPLQQLTDGMFNIASAGYHGAQGLDVLKAAAMGAKVGAADLATVADAETTIMTDFSKQHVTAAQAVNTLVAIVSDGKTHMTDLAGSLSTVLPIAAAFGIHLNDVAAAMATMTGEGTPAADAATYLRQTIASLESPGSKAVATLKEIGLTSTQISDEMKVSMPDTLQLIEDHLAQKFPVGSAAYANALKDIAGGTKTFQGMLELTGSHLNTLKGNMTDITQKVKDGGNSIVGWTEVQKDFNFKVDQTHQSLNAVFLKIGEDLIPVVSDLMTKYVQPLLKNFLDWANNSSTLHDVLHTVGDVIGGMLSTLGTFATDVGNVVTWFQQGSAPASLLSGAIKTVGAMILTVKVKDMVSDFMTFTTDTVPKVIAGIAKLTGIDGFSSIKASAKDAAGSEGIGAIGPAITDAEGTIKTESLAMASDLTAALGPLAAIVALGGQAVSILGNSKTSSGLTVNQIENINKNAGVPTWAQGPFANYAPGHATGILNNPVGHWATVGEKGPEQMYVPQGASILPHGMTPGGTGGGSQQVNMIVDGQTLARIVFSNAPGIMRPSLGLVGV